jgi:hypothetical protein
MKLQLRFLSIEYQSTRSEWSRKPDRYLIGPSGAQIKRWTNGPAEMRRAPEGAPYCQV